MSNLTSPEVGDLLKTTVNQEPVWLLVESVGDNAAVTGKYIRPGSRIERPVINHTEAVTAIVREAHGKTTVYDAMTAALGRSAIGLLRG